MIYTSSQLIKITFLSEVVNEIWKSDMILEIAILIRIKD